MPATHAASTPRTTNGPAPPVLSGPALSSVLVFDAPRRSAGRRLTALTLLDIGTPGGRLEARGAATPGPRGQPVKLSRYQSTMASPANRPTRLPRHSQGPNGMPFLRPSCTP